MGDMRVTESFSTNEVRSIRRRSLKVQALHKSDRKHGVQKM